jgi:hypothetical protein
MLTTDITYENHLKPGYAVDNGPGSMIITKSSCYRLAEETLWLVPRLPAAGKSAEYFKALSDLGLEYPQKIFDRLISLGVLREGAPKKGLKALLTAILQPNITLIPPRAQEWTLKLVDRLRSKVWLGLILCTAIAGFIGGLTLINAWPGGGPVNGPLIFLLIVLGSLVHELGHSIAAGAAGIGLRPIGFSVYLFYPVFHTNVSGMERLPLGRQLAIDCGGFIAQSAYLLLLVLAALLTGSNTGAEAIRWIVLIMAFNLNPLLRTDAYWIYADLREKYGDRFWMSHLHRVYLLAFALFSLYILWQVGMRAGQIMKMVQTAFTAPATLLHEGHRIIIGLYFVIMALMGGVRRFKEGREEWSKLAKRREEA